MIKTTSILASLSVGLVVTAAAHAQNGPLLPYTAQAFTPAHGELGGSRGNAAELANEEYVKALARVVYYWAYPAIDVMSRTSQWQLMKEGPGSVLGIFPGGPMNKGGCLADYMSPTQRMVVTPNNDTIYMSGLADLGKEPAVIQTPTTSPSGHYWTIQIADVFTNVIYQLGSAAGTAGGKYLLVTIGPRSRDITALPNLLPVTYHASLRRE
jgi:hypothetical protein